MDSANTGSPQSSSGGDDEYDSRSAAADHPVFMNLHTPRPPSLFDPFSNYTQQQQQQQQQQQISACPRSAPIRSDPNPQLHSLINPFVPSVQQPQPPPMPQDGPENKNSNAGASTAATRNPRKRSRASRRAPTTVLTTDTTNFRAMVQEFTGIPAPPFSNQSFARPHRLDNLFGPSRSAMEAAPPRFTRHPFDQTTPFLVSGSTAPMINYQQLPFPSHIQTSNTNTNNNILLSNIHNNNNNNENPFFSSLLQTNPSKFTFSGSPTMASKPHNQFGPGPEEFGLGGHGGDHHLHVTTPNELRNLIPSYQGRTREDRDDGRDNGSAAKWRRHNDTNNNENDSNGGDHQLNVGYDFSGSALGQEERGSGSENIGATRVGDQGMVESWINNSSE